MHVLITLLAVEWPLMVLLSYLCLEEQGTRLTVRKMSSLTFVYIHGVTVAFLSYISFLLHFFLFASSDPQTPLGISVCDNLAAWLERDGNHELKQETTVEKEELFSHIDSLTKGETRTFERKKEGEENE